MSAPFSLAGKTALITGASRGIGAATAAALAAAGAQVWGTATSAEGAAKLAAQYAGGLQYNAAQAGAAQALATAAMEQMGGAPHIVVFNAAINADTLLFRMKEAQWRDVLEANLTASFMLAQALAQGMAKARRGRLIFLSSVVATIGNAGQANYCASKAGLEGFCRATARELAGRNITANAIAPGFIATDMTDKLPSNIKERFVSNIPAARAGTPEEVAAACVFLASDEAAYITGQTLHINGGMRMG